MTDLSKENHRSMDTFSYEEALTQTDSEIRRQLRRAPMVIRSLTTHLSRGVGKKIRARALLACSAQNDGLIKNDAIKAAAAVELLHLATLVHDDIIDNAGKRRGIETLHTKYGEKSAVLCGDFLFCTAFQLVSTVSSERKNQDKMDNLLPQYLTDVCLGELRQNQNSFNYHLSEREYFKTIYGKTAALFEASFYTGFLLSDEPDSMKNDFIKIGKNIGLIFQLADDCADYEATQKETKKPVLSDFRQGVITLPLIFALKTDSQLKERIAAGIEPEALKDAVLAAGGLRDTHLKITAYYQRTEKILKSLEIASEKKTLIKTFLDQAAGVLPV